MESTAASKRPLKLSHAAPAVVAFWALVGLFNFANSYVYRVLSGSPPPGLTMLFWSIGSWSFYSLVTWPLYLLVKRFTARRRHWLAGAAVLAVGAVIVIVLMAAWDTVLILSLSGIADMASIFPSLISLAPGMLFKEILIRYPIINLLSYTGLVAGLYALITYRRLQDQEVTESRLAAQLAAARLAVLKMQMQPHFLFNTLNSISALMHVDIEAADRMVVRLADLLRATMDTGTVQEIPLRQELELLERYLEIEQVRFSDRLTVAYEIGETARNAMVPSLILQPLVENAILHGISRRRDGGRVVIAARQDGEELELTVSDNGAGLKTASPAEGMGLSIARQRMGQLYGVRQSCELSGIAGGGARVRMVLPFRTDAEAGAEGGGQQ